MLTSSSQEKHWTPELLFVEKGRFMRKAIKLIRAVALMSVSVVLITATAGSAHSQSKSAKRLASATREAQKAANVFTEIMNVPDQAIPQKLLDKAEAVAVFPGVIKAGFIIGGRAGDGVISRRVKGGWSAPAFFNLAGGSVGLQIGASKTDFVLLFMNEEALNGLLKDKFEIGGEGSVAAGPVGRSASASTDALLKAGIISYSRSKGAFAGLEIKGVVISPDNEDNLAVYRKKSNEILSPARPWTMAQMPAGVRIVPRTLARYSVRR
jgi:lipid-binding SYLF domain-containing protein